MSPYNLGVIGHGSLYRDMQSFIAKLKGKEDPNSIIGLLNPTNKHKVLSLNNIDLEY